MPDAAYYAHTLAGTCRHAAAIKVAGIQDLCAHQVTLL